MKKESFEKDLLQIIKIAKAYNAKKIFLFGSCLNELKNAHDIDIAVQGIPPDKFFKMYGEILSSINSKIDLLPMEDLRKHFISRIIENGKLLYG